MFWRISTFIMVLLCVSVGTGKERTWTSADGRTMKATFVRELDGEVTFLKDGKLIAVRLEKLSEKDQQLIKDLAAGNEAAGEESDAAANPVKGKKPLAIQTRTWTDRFGLKSSGKFVRVDGDDVVLSRGARVITVPFGNLSEDDQRYVEDVLTSQGKADEIPSKSPPDGGGRGDAFPGAGNGFPGTGNPGGMPPGGMPGGALPPGIGRAGGPGMGRGVGAFPPGGAIPGAGGGMMPPGIGMMPPGMTPPGPGMAPPAGGGSAFPPGMGFPGADPAEGMAGAGMMPPGMTPAGISGSSNGRMPGMPGAGGYSGVGEGRIGGAGMGGSAMPGSTMPGMSPPPIPAITFPDLPQPTFSSPTFERAYKCSGCGAKISEAQSSLSKCPHCGTLWGFKQDQFGRKTMTSVGGGRAATIGIVIIVFVILGMIVFVALFVGIIVAIVRAATAAPAPPQPQRYY